MVVVASKMLSQKHILACILKIPCDCFERESYFLGHLTKLSQRGREKNYIAAFETLALRMKGLGDEFYFECFMIDLKESIHAHFEMHHLPTWRDACKKVVDVELSIGAEFTCPNFLAKGHSTKPEGPSQTLMVQKVSQVEMVERRK